MTKLASLLAVSGIAILTSAGAAFAADQVPAVTVFSQSPAGQEAYADAVLAAGAQVNDSIQVGRTEQGQILRSDPAGLEAQAQNVLAQAADDEVRSNVASNTIVIRQDPSGQAAYAEEILAAAANSTGMKQVAAQIRNSAIRSN